MEITSTGDSALIVRVCEENEAPSERCGRAVLEVVEQLRVAKIPGVIEIAPAFASVGVFYDPLVVEAKGDDLIAALSGRIRAALRDRLSKKPSLPPRRIKIPVCYEEPYTIDLDEVSARSGISPNEYIERHTSAPYRVRCVGFTPGFPYLTGLPAELAMPRRASPRKEIPAGSVAIGGSQAGIYPSVSPGGWHVIGRTPLQLFSVRREQPSLLRAGDSVHFFRITSEQFERWQNEH